MPEPFARAVSGLRVDEAVVGHHTATPGAAGHCGELVLFGSDAGGPLLLSIDARLEEGFSDPESQWLVRGPADGPVGRRERQERACATLGLERDRAPVEAWQLVHRLVASVEEAERRGVARAIVAVHSFVPDIRRRTAGFDQMYALAAALSSGTPLRSGAVWWGHRVRSVELGLLWVADDFATQRSLLVRRRGVEG